MSATPIHLFRRLIVEFALLVGLLLLTWSVSLPVQAVPTHAPGQLACVAKLKPLLQTKMQQLRIPGAMVYVDDPGQCSWASGLGMSNLTSREPMQVNNFMHIGSITKTFTATVILQLVDQGKLILADRVIQPPTGATIIVLANLYLAAGQEGPANELAKVIQQELFA
jgi:Beta-lactamase